MKDKRFWIAMIVFVAALVHLVATLDGVHARWLGLVSVALTIGTLAMLILQWKAARDA